MSELGPNAKQLIDAGRKAFKPTEADRQRVLSALMPQLGASLAPAAAATAQGFGKGAFAKLSLAVVGIGVVGGGLLLVQPTETPTESPSVQPTVLTAPAPTEVRDVPETPAPPPTTEAVVEAPESTVTRAQRSADRLAEEVEILSRAGTALRSGRPSAALKALDEHQRRFPSGVLSQERSAARVQALCALGRTDDGLRELKRLERAAPGSPHVVRAQKACAVGAKP